MESEKERGIGGREERRKGKEREKKLYVDN